MLLFIHSILEEGDMFIYCSPLEKQFAVNKSHQNKMFRWLLSIVIYLLCLFIFYFIYFLDSFYFLSYLFLEVTYNHINFISYKIQKPFSLFTSIHSKETSFWVNLFSTFLDCSIFSTSRGQGLLWVITSFILSFSSTKTARSIFLP